MQADPLGALALRLAGDVAGSAADALATPAGLGAVLQGRSLWHRIRAGVVEGGSDAGPPPDPLRDARYRFESPSRFTATLAGRDGEPVTFVLTRYGLRWKVSDVRLPLSAEAAPAGG